MQTPRPMVVHIVNIDLKADGVRFLVTPGGGASEMEMKARRTTKFIKEFDLQLAVNAGFFYPFYSKGLWFYYPKENDPTNVCGLAISQGEKYSAEEENFNSLYISRDNQVSIGQPLEDSFNVVSGHNIFTER